MSREQRDLEALLDERDRLSVDCANLQASVADTRRERDIARMEVRDLKADAIQYNAKAVEQRIGDLRSERDQLRADLEAARVQHSQALLEADEHKGIGTRLQTGLEAARRDAKEAQAIATSAMDDVDSARQERDTAREEAARLTGAIEALEHAHSQRYDEINSLSGECARAEKERDALKAELGARDALLIAHREAWQQERDALKAELAQLTNAQCRRLTAEEIEVAGMRVELAQARAELAQLRAAGPRSVWVLVANQEEKAKECLVVTDSNVAWRLFLELKAKYGGANVCYASRALDDISTALDLEPAPEQPAEEPSK